MPLSKNIIEKSNAESLAIEYKPKSIGQMLSEEALEYVQNKQSRGDFRVDKIVAEYVGIDELEKESQQKELAKQALELSKEVEEQAYAEAYQLGLKEGTEKAYAEEKNRIEQEMQKISDLVSDIKRVKADLFKDNEKQIVNLCFYIAKRLLMKEIEVNEEYITTLIKRTLEMNQSDEEIVIRMSPEDKVWVDAHQESVFKDLNLDKNATVVEDREIQRGGVIIETNYGVIDATLDQRLEKLEDILKNQN